MGGYDAFSIEEVARRAHVAKTTLYRRWPTKDHLALAIVAQIQEEIMPLDTGDIRADLTRWTQTIAGELTRVNRAAGVVPELVAAAARHPELGEALRGMFGRRRAVAALFIQAAAERGELRADIDPLLLIDQLAGALYYRVLITGQPIGEAYVRQLVHATLDGVAVPSEKEKNTP